MSQRIWGSGAAPALESVVPMFVFRLGGELVEWNWADGSPPWRSWSLCGNRRLVRCRVTSRRHRFAGRRSCLALGLMEAADVPEG